MLDIGNITFFHYKYKSYNDLKINMIGSDIDPTRECAFQLGNLMLKTDEITFTTSDEYDIKTFSMIRKEDSGY